MTGQGPPAPPTDSTWSDAFARSAKPTYRRGSAPLGPTSQVNGDTKRNPEPRLKSNRGVEHFAQPAVQVLRTGGQSFRDKRILVIGLLRNELPAGAV